MQGSEFRGLGLHNNVPLQSLYYYYYKLVQIISMKASIVDSRAQQRSQARLSAEAVLLEGPGVEKG